MYKRGKILIILIIVTIVTIPFNVFGESLGELQDKLTTVSEKKDALENQVKNYNSRLEFLEKELLDTQTKISTNKAELEKIKTELERQNSFLAANILATYEEDKKSFFELFFSSRTLSEFLNRSEYLEINRIKLKETADQVEALKDDAQETEKNLASILEVQRVLKESLVKERDAAAKELEKATREEKVLLDKFTARYFSGAKNPYCKGEGRVVKAKYPVFSFPVNCGYISQGFGMTEYAKIDNGYNGKIHNGFDVGIGTGNQIFSVGKGTVYAKGVSPSGGWGNWIMVKQDSVNIAGKSKEFYALYAHMAAESHLKVGQKVNGNTLVGFVGGTPYWAPHLHFSLFFSNSGWSNGTIGAYPGNSVDPLDYMDIPISVEGTDWDRAYLHI